MHTRTSLRLCAVVALVAWAGVGCVPVLDTPETRYYVLGTLPADTQALPGVRREPPLAVDVGALTIPQYLERPQIVTRVDRNQLLLAEFDKWGGNLEKNMLRSLAGNLSMLLATPEVHAAARRSPERLDARVEIEVNRFERGEDGRVVLDALWRVFAAGRDREPRAARSAKLTSAPLPAGAGMDATVAAMTDLLGALSREIASAIQEHADS